MYMPNCKGEASAQRIADMSSNMESLHLADGQFGRAELDCGAGWDGMTDLEDLEIGTTHCGSGRAEAQGLVNL